MFDDVEDQLSAVSAATLVAAVLAQDVCIFSDLSIGTAPNNYPKKRILEIIRYRPEEVWDVD
jgi:ABC-type phosphate/phosphonate transport system permease subunit